MTGSWFYFVCRTCLEKIKTSFSTQKLVLFFTNNFFFTRTFPELKYPFTCDPCQRKFTRKSSLRTHMLTHKSNQSNTDLKYPFTCESCKKKFKQKINLRVHMLTHESNPDLKHPLSLGTVRISGTGSLQFWVWNPKLESSYLPFRFQILNLGTNS